MIIYFGQTKQCQLQRGETEYKRREERREREEGDRAEKDRGDREKEDSKDVEGEGGTEGDRLSDQPTDQLIIHLTPF